MQKRNRILAVCAVLILLAGGFFLLRSGREEEPDGAEAALARSADAIFLLTLADEDGASAPLAEFRGKNLIINAWATWCPYCLAELADFRDVAGEYGERIVVIAINRQEPRDAGRAYVARNNLGGRIEFLFDPEDDFYKAIQGFSMPETIFIDREGVIRFHKRGPMNREEIRRRAQDIFGI